ncbi:hypothetical protein RhiJN_26542 [Ceratobasidium sp. AG-Ba]|nr:hypothetical protein RhiJN_12487 [Ceratobasidium sp. AG-Ba]QRV98523.1 hypothetical protein RhiJN_26542 [Ceratobasidium sp. AG-Ba]
MPNKIVSSFGSLSQNKNSQLHVLNFTSEWGVGPVFNWYNKLEPLSKLIGIIQVRKDVSGAVPHRFIVVRMLDDAVHRFDRRPERPENAGTNLVDVVFNNAVTSQDSYTLNITLADLERVSELEVELELDGGVDLSVVISVCYAISLDSFAQKYTFLRHNCFFFSWTILTIVSRHHLPYRLPEEDSVLRLFGDHLDRLTQFIVDQAVALFLDLVIDTAIIFRDTALASMPDGVGLMGPVGSAFPNWLLRFIWRQSFKLRLRFGLRSPLTAVVKRELTQAVRIVQKATLSSHIARPLLDQHLWIEGTQDGVRKAIDEEIKKILWKTILEVISSGYANTDSTQLQQQLTDPQLNVTILGKKVAELCTVFGAALQAGLLATREAAKDIQGLSHENAFDEAWKIARDASLTAAKNAVQRTREIVDIPGRDAKWEVIWSIWGTCWEQAHDIVQPRAIVAVKNVVEEVLTAGTGVVIKDVRESRHLTIQAQLPGKRRKWLIKRRPLTSRMTNADLQECMRRIIKKNTVNGDALDAVQSSMERVWANARGYLSIGNMRLATIQELQ